MNVEGLFMCSNGSRPKRCYSTKGSACNARKNGIELRPYMCGCGYWHLTKLSKQEYRAFQLPIKTLVK